MAKQKGVLPRRQDLERESPEAFISAAELRAQHAAFEQHLSLSHARRTLLRGSVLTRADGSKHGRRVARVPVLSLSHTWLTQDHPDPFGHTVAEIGRIIARERRLWRRCGVTEFGVFFDWASMYQKDEAGQRTEAQRESFGRALNTMTIFYAHRLTTVCLMTRHPYAAGYPESYARGDDRGGRHVASPRLYCERGWTSFERANAELINPTDYGNCWSQIIDAGNAPVAASLFSSPPHRLFFAVELLPRRLGRLARALLGACFSGSRVEPLLLQTRKELQLTRLRLASAAADGARPMGAEGGEGGDEKEQVDEARAEAVAVEPAAAPSEAERQEVDNEDDEDDEGDAAAEVEDARRSIDRLEAREAWLMALLRRPPSRLERLLAAFASAANHVLPGLYKRSARGAPASPRAFFGGGRFADKVFTNNADATTVARLFERTSKEIYGGATRLEFGGMEWDDAQFDELLGVLAYADPRDGEVEEPRIARGRLVPRLAALDVSGNRITIDGAERLAAALEDPSIMPRLADLNISRNRFTYCPALRAVCETRGISLPWRKMLLHRLRTLFLTTIVHLPLTAFLFLFLLVVNGHVDHLEGSMIAISYLADARSMRTFALVLLVLAVLLATFAAWGATVGPRTAHYGRWSDAIFLALLLVLLSVDLLALGELLNYTTVTIFDNLAPLNYPPAPPPPPGAASEAAYSFYASVGAGWLVVYSLLLFGPLSVNVTRFVYHWLLLVAPEATRDRIHHTVDVLGRRRRAARAAAERRSRSQLASVRARRQLQKLRLITSLPNY